MEGDESGPFRRGQKEQPSFWGTNTSFSTLSNLTQLTPSTQRHLRNVYQNLTFTTLFAALACYLLGQGTISEPGILAVLMLFGSLLAIVFTPNTPENNTMRHGALYSFGFAEGWLVSPLVNTVMWVNPGTVFLTLIATILIFASFTASSFYSPRRQYLYLGGLLGTVMSLMMVGSLANMFIGSTAWLTAEIYLGLFLFSFYVLYDTQVIVERAEGGQRDAPLHAVMLFTDFAAIFFRLLVLLSRERDGERRNGGGGGGGAGGGRRSGRYRS